MIRTSTPPGTIARHIVASLKECAPFKRWRSQVITRAEYSQELDAVLACRPSELSENSCALSARMHWNPRPFVDAVLTSCRTQGMITHRHPLAHRTLGQFSFEMDTQWDHATYSTYIFPEEAQLLYAIAQSRRPARIGVMGSYYGYWAAWAIAGAGSSLEEVVLLDIDPDANALAASNLRQMGLAHRAKVRTEDAVAYMHCDTGTKFDLIVLDAEGPTKGPDPRWLGKAIYGPMVEAAVPRLARGALLVAHNILLDRSVRHPYFDALVRQNERELNEFKQIIEASAHTVVRVPTTEGVGVYML
jgi:predicted O-methyltransferase YrrM